MRTPPAEFLEFIWHGQEGLFELASEPSQREHFSRADALASLAGKRYFAPMARKHLGSTKGDVADTGNVLWADIDSLEGLDRIGNRLVPLGIVPSAVIFSGMKGYWVYLKLTEALPTAKIEQLNKHLAALLDADNCWNCDRIARLPGSIHQASGKLAEVVEFTGTLYAPTDLVFPSEDTASPRSDHAEFPALLQEGSARFPSFAKLSADLWKYIAARPEWGQGYDRSVEEQRIFLALVTQGWSDTAIVSFASTYRLSRHLEEAMRRARRCPLHYSSDEKTSMIYEWTLRSIAKARTYVETNSLSIHSVSTNTPMCMRSVHYHQTPREDMLKCVDGQSTNDLVHEIVVRTGCSVKTARRGISQLEAKGFIHRQKIGRVVFNHLTPKAREWLDRRFKTELWLPPVKKRAA
jgi:hypothetical protein